MRVNNKSIYTLAEMLKYASYWKDKNIKEKKIEDSIEDFLSLRNYDKETLLKNVKVNFDLTASMYFIKKISTYNIDALLDSYDVLLKQRRFKMEKNNDLVLDFMFNQWKILFEILKKFKNKKEKIYDSILGKEVDYNEVLNLVIMNMPSGMNFDLNFTISYYELKRFIEIEDNSFIEEIQEFITEIKKLPLFIEFTGLLKKEI